MVSRYLDLSGTCDTYEHPDQTLASTVESLVNLECLDISMTNLAGFGDPRDPTDKKDIIGLRSRAGRPLKFLGLYLTQGEACKRHNIPADVVRTTEEINEVEFFSGISLIHSPNDFPRMYHYF